ncbi:MAG: PPOX class F420-dependent oxidoreductase [Chloroflexi bacterium]|nr:PPOX class F420-dependent oxidoreductase [Chloroflexota bacterium]
MSKEETQAFLLEKPRTAKLASVRADGRPHVAPIWFTLDGDDLIFTTWHTTVKAANLHNNPRVAICVDDDAPPYAFVLIEGTAKVEAHAKDLLHWATRLAERYMGKEQAESFGERNAVEGELLVRVTPTKIIAQSGIAD